MYKVSDRMPLVQPLTINSLIRANIIGHGVQMLGEPSILLRCDRPGRAVNPS